ncbi:hypothetical protein E2562_036737 [Oryza meyeriana var. granulata]|uniref:Uncharacterized protein n=1 Tax=Oryza meyeriana var. granulata TaxID=110450 RepID=A0A6G1DT37_9ORYZ|nr:hypothetical protein E2562_036737 [Oryza meyeriana var. granulata]
MGGVVGELVVAKRSKQHAPGRSVSLEPQTAKHPLPRALLGWRGGFRKRKGGPAACGAEAAAYTAAGSDPIFYTEHPQN